MCLIEITRSKNTCFGNNCEFEFENWLGEERELKVRENWENFWQQQRKMRE